MTMKPARERFFPSPSTPRAASGTNFTNPHDRPLRSTSSLSGGRHRGQDSVVLSALDKFQNTGVGRPQMGLGYPAFTRKLAAGSITRPGTAEPSALNVRIENGTIPVIAPMPRKYHQISPPFALPDGPFGSDTLDVSRDNHSSKSPETPIEEGREENFKMPFPKFTKPHQRVPGQSEPSQYQSMLNDCGEDGPNASLHRNRKRMRELDEIEDSDVIERNAKRFKTREVEEDDKMSRESRSPHLDRLNSTVSSAVGLYPGRSNGVAVNMPPARHLLLERQENPEITLNGTHVGLPSRRRSEPVGLDKLLGLGSNDLLDEHAGKYEALLKKWSECSVEEWRAGAEEISARFTMMLDFTKDYVDKKLKTYSGINAVLDSHSEILRERRENMEFARQEAVEKAAKVLGHMIFNDSSFQERGSLLNEQPADKAGACSAKYCDRDEFSGDAAASGPTDKNPKLSSRQKTCRSISSSPLSWSQGLSPSGHDQSQLHRRTNRHRKTGSQGGKENIPPHLLCQPGKTYTAKARRSALADVTTARQGASQSFEDVSFAGSTSIHSPSRKIGNGEPGAAGLKFELDPKPFLSKSDSQETVTAQNSFAPIVVESVDHPSTPLREVLASFNDMFSSTFTFQKSTSGNHSFRRLPASSVPTISNALNISILADSISQLTGEIAASIKARYENDHLYQGQYNEDAVVRDERFDWEEEMRCLEIQCGSYGETK